MSATRIDGTKIAGDLRSTVRRHVARLAKSGLHPCLATVVVGDNPASLSYIRGKQRACQETGVEGIDVRLPESISQDDLVAQIHELNGRTDVHGILVQAPLPPHLSQEAVVEAILPSKDVDGFHPQNLGNLLRGNPALLPCTPFGIVELLRRSSIALSGKRVVIVGRSLLVGRPLAALLMRRGIDATVTVCHSATKNLEKHTRSAQILIAAMGRAEFLTAEMIEPGSVVVDVGINRVADDTRKRGYRLVGDVDYDAVVEIASAVTPVPGGVGPMTVAVLLLNTIQAAQGNTTETPLADLPEDGSSG
jgi:methylenetetrahydrofolate dehydrogenase (NADP+) / methenyltetrahydrofolate cyclohydrolase